MFLFLGYNENLDETCVTKCCSIPAARTVKHTQNYPVWGFLPKPTF